MPRALSDEAIVLRTRDIGEADRLCILLTREHGKIAARANGVRKLKSRKGSSMLPLQHVRMEFRQGSAGFVVHAASCIRPHEECRKNLRAYAVAQHAVGLLLAFLEDHEPVPEIYDLTLECLAACDRNDPHVALRPIFTLRLLSLLGLLPSLTSSGVSNRSFHDGDAVAFSERVHGLCLVEEDAAARRLSVPLMKVLRELPSLRFSSLPVLAHEDGALLETVAYSMLGSQPGASSPAFAFASGSSPAAMPI